MEIKDIIGVIIALAVGSIVAAAIIPTAIGDITNATTTGWDSATKSVWGLMSVIVALSVLMVFLRVVR